MDEWGGHPARAGAKTLDAKTFIDPRFGNVKTVNVIHPAIFRIRLGAANDFEQHLRRPLRSEFKHRQRRAQIFAANQVHNQAGLARADGRPSEFCEICTELKTFVDL